MKESFIEGKTHFVRANGVWASGQLNLNLHTIL
jgi:hypothetical protein